MAHSTVWDQVLDLMFAGLGVIFDHRTVAPLVILPAMLLTATVIWIWTAARVMPWLKAADTRINVIRDALGKDTDAGPQRASFAAHFGAVDDAMRSLHGVAPDLARGWDEYRETIVDPGQSPIRTIARPGPYFAKAAPSLTHLAFWSNIFVGLGLVLTFCGIVVALNETAGAMQGGVMATQAALHQLLIIASAKFFSSIAGITASLMMRVAERDLTQKVKKRLARISDRLERGLQFVSPQALAAEQLGELKRQSGELRRMADAVADLAGALRGGRAGAAG